LLTINEFPTPTFIAGPEAITAGPDGNLWFTESEANQIGKITPSGSITEFSIRTANAGLTDITAGRDGNLWFTENSANQIGQISSDGSHVMEFKIPTRNSHPTHILTGPDGDLWFKESNVNQIGRLDPASGRITEIRVPESGPFTFGPDGNIWSAEGGHIARITPDGSQITEFPIPTPNAPSTMTVGPDGNLWFAEQPLDRIGYLNLTDFRVREFTLPTMNGSSAGAIITAPDGNLWFTESSVSGISQIWRITPDGQYDAFQIPTRYSRVRSITVGPDGNLWFTEHDGSRIGQYILDLPATHLLVSIAGTTTAGRPFDVSVTAQNVFNHTVTGYTGTVHFSNSDPSSTLLPADYTFSAGDKGFHTFQDGATLLTAGTQTITATDTVSGINGSATVTVPPVVMTTDYWTNPAGGGWETPSNWSNGTVPGPDDDVIIEVPGAITITHGTGTDSVHSLTNNQNLVLTGGSSLTVTDTLSQNGSLLVDAGSSFLVNGTYAETGALTVLAGGTFVAAGSFSNFSGGTLTGGSYSIGGTFQFTGAAISTNAATIILDGPASQIVDEANNDALAYFASNEVGASFTIQNGRNFSTAGDYRNGGGLTIGTGSTFTVNGGYTQTDGITTLSDATLSASGLVDLKEGTLSGTGTINASVQNAGLIQVGSSSAAGLITINGNYTQTADGVLIIGIGGDPALAANGIPTVDHDPELAISGMATLDGTLKVTVINGLTLSPGDDFWIITYGSVSGAFATTTPDFLSPEYYADHAEILVPRF
jgi:streptogramin lyase